VRRIEAGGPQPTGTAGQAAQAMRTALDEARANVQRYGKLQHFVEDYFPHIWEDPTEARSVIGRMLGRRPLRGSGSFLKQRTIPTIEEGLAAGLQPVADNPVDMVLLKLREMNRYTMGQQVFNDLKAQGLVQLVPYESRAPAGYVRINDPIARAGSAGAYWAPADAARVLNNYLAPGLRGNVLYDAYHALGNTANQAQLGLSAFHLGFTSLDASVSKAAIGARYIAAGRVLKGFGEALKAPLRPFTGAIEGDRVLREYSRPGSQGAEIGAIADALTQGGGRVRMDRFYKNNSVEALTKALRRKDPISAAFHVIPAALELAAKPILEYVVPRQKLGVFADLWRFERERLGPNATPEMVREAARTAWKSVDNRMGQLVYDTEFWNRTAKDLAMVSVRAVGWNVGTIREVGGGMADLLRGRFTHRASYVVALPVAVGLYGAIYQYLMTGQGPGELKDYFYPKTGRLDQDGNPDRVVLPSYMKDIASYAKHPVQTMGHKLHPLIGTVAEMLQNENYYGDQIRNPHDPIVQQAKQVATYLGDQVIPIAIRNAAEQRRREQSLAVRAQSFVGIVPARREDVRTKAQNRMQEYLSQGAGGLTPEQQAAGRQRADVLAGLRNKTLGPGELGAKVQQGLLTLPGAKRLARRAQIAPTLDKFKRLSLPEALDVYRMATPTERRVWRPALQQKVLNAAHAGTLTPAVGTQARGLLTAVP
jgi:hypothetical protein